MTDFKLNIHTAPINQTAGFIYMGYAKDKLIVGETHKSMLGRYGKTASWGDFFGIDLQSFEGWRNIDILLNEATRKARKKTSKGKPLEFAFQGELVNLGVQSKLTTNFNKVAEKFLIYICNRKFGKPLGRKEEHYYMVMDSIPFVAKKELINDLLENHFIPVWELMLEDVTKYNEDYLIELYEDLKPWENQA
jgi:hypothetical protein